MSKVLIADDDDMMLEFLRFKLESRGYDVLGAADGEEALALVLAEAPDLVVLDGMMPGLDGYEVLQQLKAKPETSDLPVLMLTARKKQEDVVRGLQLGADDYLIKPFMPEELLLRIEKALDERRKKNERASA